MAGKQVNKMSRNAYREEHLLGLIKGLSQLKRTSGSRKIVDDHMFRGSRTNFSTYQAHTKCENPIRLREILPLLKPEIMDFSTSSERARCSITVFNMKDRGEASE